MGVEWYQFHPTRVEVWFIVQFVVGLCFAKSKRVLRWLFSVTNEDEKKSIDQAAHELRRKAFHVLGGTLIVFSYYIFLKYDIVTPGYAFADRDERLDFARVFAPFVFLTWSLDFLRAVHPGVQRLFFMVAGGVVREKERENATGMSYFLPGALLATIFYPPEVAMMAVMYLTMGDAAAGIGCALGKWKWKNTERKVEGSVACFVVCVILGLAVLQPAPTLWKHLGVVLGSALWVTWCELWAEVIHIDDNLFIPLVGGLGVQAMVHGIHRVLPVGLLW